MDDKNRIHRLENTVDVLTDYLKLAYQNMDTLVDELRKPEPNLEAIASSIANHLSLLKGVNLIRK